MKSLTQPPQHHLLPDGDVLGAIIDEVNPHEAWAVVYETTEGFWLAVWDGCKAFQDLRSVFDDEGDMTAYLSKMRDLWDTPFYWSSAIPTKTMKIPPITVRDANLFLPLSQKIHASTDPSVAVTRLQFMLERLERAGAGAGPQNAVRELIECLEGLS